MGISRSQAYARHNLVISKDRYPTVSKRVARDAKGDFFRQRAENTFSKHVIEDLDRGYSCSWKNLTAMLPGPRAMEVPSGWKPKLLDLRKKALDQIEDRALHFPLRADGLRALGLIPALQSLAASRAHFGELARKASAVLTAFEKRDASKLKGRAALLYHLGSFAYEHSDFRDQNKAAREFYYLYKNDRRFGQWLERIALGCETNLSALIRSYRFLPKGFMTEPDPRTVDLGDDQLRTEEKLFQQYPALEFLRLCRSQVIYKGGLKKKACAYERAVLELRAGDTVCFGKTQFHLKRYLGAGNASHVWQVEEGGVLKIPFFGADMLHIDNPTRCGIYEPRDPVDGPRQFVERFLLRRKDYEASPHFRAVKILGHGPRGEFLWVEYVDIKITGDRALAMVHRGQTPHEFGPESTSVSQRLNAALVAGANIDVQTGTLQRLPWYPNEWVSVARQFAWDGQDWVCMDWE